MTIKITKVRALAAGFLTALMVSVPAVAHADNASAEGLPSTGNGGTMTAFIWRSVTTDKNGTAFKKFATGKYPLSGYKSGNTQRKMAALTKTNATGQTAKNKKAKFMENCAKSETIWWLQGNRKYNSPTKNWENGWAADFSASRTWPQIGAKGMKFTDAIPIGTRPRQEIVDNVNAYLKKTDLNKDRYVIVCSNMDGGVTISTSTKTKTPPPPGDDTKTPPPPVTVNDPGPSCSDGQVRMLDQYRSDEPYQWLTSAEPQLFGGVDKIGEVNLHAQLGKPQLTNYRNTYHQVVGTQTKPSAVRASVAAALNADKQLDHSKIDLDQPNKEGMAEGGVLNFLERTTPATINSWEWECGKNVQVPITDSEGKITGWTTQWQRMSGPHVKTTGTVNDPYLSGFWQMLSVHCNEKEFNALTAATAGVTVENTGDPSRRIAAVAYTKEITNPKGISMPAQKDFGDTGNSNAAKKRSGELGFYDKECPFDCTADAGGPGASIDNDAENNLGNTAPDGGTVSARYGAQSDEHNRNRFTFFRDNTPHGIRMDVQYPKSGGVVKYNGDEPVSTTITRWAYGTPDGSKGGQFTISTDNGDELFKGTGNTTPEQKNWDVKPFSTSLSEQVEGLVNNFDVKATWPSEKNKPQLLVARWEYAPEVSTRFVTKTGFDKDNQRTLDVIGTESTPIQGKCFAGYGSKPSDPTFHDKVQDFTGTGSTNKIDGVLIESPSLGKDDVPGDKWTELMINFVRATSE